MTKITVYENGSKEYVGFRAQGHAGFRRAGKDIVCAAISILTINTVNAIGQFTDAEVMQHIDEAACLIEFRLREPDREAVLLLRTMVLGLQSMAADKDYGKHMDLTFEEV